jgi:hypothetical protein
MGFGSKAAKALDKTAAKVGDKTANVVIAPVRRLINEPCTCGKKNCPSH